MFFLRFLPVSSGGKSLTLKLRTISYLTVILWYIYQNWSFKTSFPVPPRHGWDQ